MPWWPWFGLRGCIFDDGSGGSVLPSALTRTHRSNIDGNHAPKDEREKTAEGPGLRQNRCSARRWIAFVGNIVAILSPTTKVCLYCRDVTKQSSSFPKVKTQCSVPENNVREIFAYGAFPFATVRSDANDSTVFPFAGLSCRCPWRRPRLCSRHFGTT